MIVSDFIEVTKIYKLNRSDQKKGIFLYQQPIKDIYHLVSLFRDQIPQANLSSMLHFFQEISN